MKTRSDFGDAAARLQGVFRLSGSQRDAIQSELFQTYGIGAADRRSAVDGDGRLSEKSNGAFAREALRVANAQRIFDDDELAPAVATAALAPLREALRDAYAAGYEQAAESMSVDSAVASVLKRITYYTIHPAEPRSLEQLKVALHGYARAIIDRAKREALADAAERKPRPRKRRARRKR